MARPTSDVVLRAYLGALIPELDGHLATALPENRTLWQTSGFVTYNVVGGTPISELTQRRPVYALECWANGGDSPKPPWGKAAALAESIVDLGERVASGVILGNVSPGINAPFSAVVVQNFRVLSEPQKIRSDASGYARFVFDAELWWAPLV